MTYRFSVSIQGSESKRSNTWSNAIKAAIKMCKQNKLDVITIKDDIGHTGASFIWDDEYNDIIPA